MQKTQIINRPGVKAGLLQLSLLQELHQIQAEAAELEESFDWLIAEYGDVLNPREAEQFHEKLQALLVSVSAITLVSMATQLHSGDGLIQPSFNTSATGSTNHSTEQVLNSRVMQSEFKAPSIESNPVQLNKKVSILALRRAIIGQESGGKFHLVNPDSGALGYAQVMPFNINGNGKGWDFEVLGRDISTKEFLASPELQLKIINGKLEQYVQSQTQPGRSLEETVRRVASMWYSGKPHRWQDTKPQYTNGRRYPSIKEYTASIWKRYQHERSNAARSSESTDTASPKPGERIGQYRVTSGYGPRRRPKSGASSYHRGVDVALPVGTPLYAIGDVEVRCQRAKAGGLEAVYESEGKRFGYSHLSKCDSGKAKDGEKIAESGNTGVSTGPHLHFSQKDKDGNFEPPYRGYVRRSIFGNK